MRSFLIATAFALPSLFAGTETSVLPASAGRAAACIYYNSGRPASGQYVVFSIAPPGFGFGYHPHQGNGTNRPNITINPDHGTTDINGCAYTTVTVPEYAGVYTLRKPWTDGAFHIFF